jgi:hypothetical protein
MPIKPPGPSKAIQKYMDRKISSGEYFREVRKETARDVARELREPSTPKRDGSR